MIYNIWKKYGVCKVRSFTKKFKLIIFFLLTPAYNQIYIKKA